MTRNTQQSDADSPAITNEDATIGDLCRHIELICPDKYDAIPHSTELRDGVLDVPLAEIATDDAPEQGLHIATVTDWMLTGSLLEELNTAIRNETMFDRGNATDYFTIAR